jgi:hypothetical protein
MRSATTRNKPTCAARIGAPYCVPIPKLKRSCKVPRPSSGCSGTAEQAIGRPPARHSQTAGGCPPRIATISVGRSRQKPLDLKGHSSPAHFRSTRRHHAPTPLVMLGGEKGSVMSQAPPAAGFGPTAPGTCNPSLFDRVSPPRAGPSAPAQWHRYPLGSSWREFGLKRPAACLGRLARRSWPSLKPPRLPGRIEAHRL